MKVIKMIRGFKCKKTEKLFKGQSVPAFSSFQRIAFRKLEMMEAAICLDILKCPPGNRLEALSGNRKGQYSIRINNQFRICFTVENDEFYNVEIVDYHR